MKKLLFIYNLYAGKGTLRGRLAPILDELTARWDVTVHPTRGAGDATAVARDRAGEFDRIVCSGGDGTLHEVVAGLMELPAERRPTVGYIPAGSTNDFAKNLELPRTLEELAAVAAAGTPRPVDVGKFNDQDFLYVAAFGAFTDLSYTTPQQVKHLFGHLAYLLGVLSRLGSIKPYAMTVEHDGGVEEDSFCYGMVSNTISVAGVKSSPAQPVALDDGLFEVTLIRQFRTPLQFQRAIRGMIACNDLLVAPCPVKRAAVKCVLQLSGHAELKDLLMGKQPDPACADSCAVLRQKMEESVPLAVRLIESYARHLQSGAPLDEYFERNYE